jgi:molybdopterin/thiamine biosynthesis adenylyltransferase
MPWKRLEQPPPGSSFDELRAFLHESIPIRKDAQRVGKIWVHIAGFVFEEEVRQGVREDAWVFLVRTEKSRGTLGPVGLLRAVRFDVQDLSARIPELAALPRQAVAVIGLGSLGAPVALEMARAQVGRLRLADFDYVDPAAGVRWVSGLEYAGALKTRAIETSLVRNYPFTQIEVLHFMVGQGMREIPAAQREADQINRLLAGANLLIDATADDNVTSALNAACTDAGVVHLVLWGIDGFGGVVARLRPGKSGCYHCLRLALSEEIIAPPPAVPNGVPRIQPRGCADRTFTASSPDLLPLATQAVRVALSTLCEGVQGGYPPIADDVFVLSLRNTNGELLRVPEWRAYVLTRNPRCPLCFGSPEVKS